MLPAEMLSCKLLTNSNSTREITIDCQLWFGLSVMSGCMLFVIVVVKFIVTFAAT